MRSIQSLQVVGPFRGTSGYDRHTREFVRHFVRFGVEVELIPLEGWSVDAAKKDREEWFESLCRPVGAATTLHFTMATQSRPRPGQRNVNYTMFEADRIPASWAAASRGHERIIVPTTSSRDAWIAAGVDADSLRIAPLGVDAASFAEPADPMPLMTMDGRPVSSFSHRFLNIAELRPRKNHQGLLRAWMRATHRDDDAVLILKTSFVHPQSLMQFQHDLAVLQQREGRSLADAAPIVFVAAMMTDAGLRSLYRAATHYISMSHGEGWDLVMMEAAVSGLRLIAPRHTAYTDYLRNDEVAFIPAPLAPAMIEGRLGAEDRVFFDGLSWWNPDEESAAAIIRSIISGDHSVTGRSPAARLASEYTWERAALRLLEALEE